jgi:rSAM/selenodomain-associated transferase 2
LISIIIPTLNEDGCLEATLQRTRRLPGEKEIIVTDGGSTDKTCDIARRYGRLIQAPRGRGTQMALGAEESRGDILLFLHADCWLEGGALEGAEEAVARGAVAGCFRQRIDQPGMAYRLIESCANFRACVLGLLYGDSGLFVRRDLYFQAGGFPKEPLLEDLLLGRNLRRLGPVLLSSQGLIHVSARRWQQRGVLRTTLLNWFITASFLLGVSPRRLARWYEAVR